MGLLTVDSDGCCCTGGGIMSRDTFFAPFSMSVRPRCIPQSLIYESATRVRIAEVLSYRFNISSALDSQAWCGL